MSEPTRNPDLPIELRFLILKAATAENQLSLEISPRTCPVTRSKHEHQETILVFAPSEKDQRNLLAVSRGFRREMIQLLWRDLSINVQAHPTQPVTLGLLAIHMLAGDLSNCLKRDFDEQNRDWSHTMEQHVVLTTGPSSLLLSCRYLHTFRLDTTQEGTDKILHPFRGLTIKTETRSERPIFPAIANSSEELFSIISNSTESDPLVSIVIYLNLAT